MGKLKTLRPLVATMKPLVNRAVGDERARSNDREKTQAWRRWYHSAQWKRLRMSVLVRDHFTCQMCGRIEGNTSLLVGDHKISHNGDRAAFFNEANIWCICKACHDGAKQRIDKARARD